jgi:glycosyltransferase involved in cell wall biosynthesis
MITATNSPQKLVMKRALRIGLFSFPRLVHGGGFEEYLITLATSLSNRGHDVCVVNASPGQHRAINVALNVYYRNPLLSDNARTTAAEVHRRLGEAKLFELPVRKMARLLRGCDVVYAKNELLDLSVLRLLRTRRLPPIVCGVHTPMWYPRALTPQARLHNTLYLGRVYRTLLAGVTAIHVSNSHDESLFPSIHGWPQDRVFRIPHPYAPRAAAQARRLTSEGPLNVLWAGRMTEQKGVDTLADIIHAVNGSAMRTDFAFVIAGSGDARLESRVRTIAECYDNVRYRGHVRHDDMARLYGGADVVLVTSNWETFPYSCLEAQSHGVPVVASDIPGCSDIVEDNVTGLLFPPGDIGAAAAALARLNDLRNGSPAKLHAIRRAARRRLRERYEPGAVIEALERMFGSVARSGPDSSTLEC